MVVGGPVAKEWEVCIRLLAGFGLLGVCFGEGVGGVGGGCCWVDGDDWRWEGGRARDREVF